MKENFYYQNPLIERYASEKMNYIFSPQFKFSSWRKLWIYLAEAQKIEGLDIKQEQIDEMKKNIDNIDFEFARKKEKELRHDVMAHIHTFAQVAPKAQAIIHLGATSAYVGDNTDLIQMKEGLHIIKNKILSTIFNLKEFANQYIDLPILAYTHFQPAQPTTLGKRTCLWIQELLMDLDEINFVIEYLPFRGLKGTTGTQASFLQLFEGDHEKVKKVNQYITEKAGFNKYLTITGQTYTRKIDSRISNLLSSIAESASKFANDIRLLANKKEIEEPFEKNQVGSSAMAYKRNPMRSERINSLSRFVISLSSSTSYTASTQWFERTLDDSANKRLAIPQAFLAIDAILDIYQNISKNMVVHEKIIHSNLKDELPFMITENIIMECVKKGGDRQLLHEEIRVLSLQAGKRIKQEGLDNNLIDLIKKNNAIILSDDEIDKMMDPSKYIGRSIEITKEFLNSEVSQALKDYQHQDQEVDLKV